MADAPDIMLERFESQLDEFMALIRESDSILDVLQSIHENEGWGSTERIFWAFQFGYYVGRTSGGPLPDVDENRGYQ